MTTRRRCTICSILWMKVRDVTNKLKAAFVGNPETLSYVYAKGRKDRVAERTNLIGAFTPDAVQTDASVLADVEVIFTTWSMPHLSSEQLAQMPNLRLLLYAAGSVQGFARPMLERGVNVVSAWRANGTAVAQFTLAQILLSLKGYFSNRAAYDGTPNAYGKAPRGPGVYGETVALLGSGTIGRQVIELLRRFDVYVIVYDPYLSEDDAAELGVSKVGSIAEAFSTAYVVSNHIPDKPETEKLIDGKSFSAMRHGATFINTGRGRTVDETDLVAVFRERPDLTALLDVTHPEPLGAGSPLTTMPNIHVTTHIAGTINDEVVRMADLCLAEFDRFIAGQALEHEVTSESLALMA